MGGKNMFKDLDFHPGKVVFNDFDIDIERPLNEQEFSLKEDILQVNYNDEFIIDIGWYPEFDIKGEFKISVIENFEWDEPIMQKKCNDIKTLHEYTKECISFVSKKLAEK